MNRAEFGVTVMGIINRARIGRTLLAAAMAFSALLISAPAQAATERALYIHYTHTKETARIVFKRNGQFVQSGLDELNYFLRDWRRNEPTKMDPRLFDLVWQVYQDVGGSQPINVVSAYRSPATNAMLAKNSSGVADNSQHMRGTAMDFFIPGVPLAKLRAAAMKRQVGGVGYYPTSGSPFVHLDTGSVRAWPRMTRAQLKEIFPDGRTMHLPNDGKPLSQEGYQIAMNEWKRCHAYPCDGGSSGTQVASGGGSGRTLMDVLFGGNNNQPTAVAAAAPVAAPAPQPAQQVAAAAPQTTSIAPVMPIMRPASLGAASADPIQVAAIPEEPALPFSTVGSAPLTEDELAGPRLVAVAMPVTRPDNLRAAADTTLPSGDAVTALAALTAPAMPSPRLIMTDPPSDTLTAYLPSAPAEPGAQRALEAIIQQAAPQTTQAAPAGLRLPIMPNTVNAATGLRTASLGTQPQSGAYTGLFDATFASDANPGDETLAAALANHVAGKTTSTGMRRPDFVAPDLDHVGEIFMTPAALSSDHFAVIFDHDEADFDPTPDMGRYVFVKGVDDTLPSLGHDRFSPVSPLALASN